jgi:hypothetical protein
MFKIVKHTSGGTSHDLLTHTTVDHCVSQLARIAETYISTISLNPDQDCAIAYGSYSLHFVKNGNITLEYKIEEHATN